ncbi:MAG TPA: heavy metal-binding domain-containing protein [Acidiferrobacterales bacterium]|nr:heavy metal-binding domain-containing protein [Acidiferrobacterales bacterium]
MKRKQTVVAGVIAAAVLGAVTMGAWYFLASKQEAPMVTAGSENQERKVLYWTDPMVPGFKSDKPGKSPFMDMEMVPVYADDAGATTVSVRPEIIQSLGVRTHKVVRSSRGITIPSEALIRTGTRNAVVLAIGAGRFQPVEVTPGAESDDWIEIRQGIKAGDVVVTSGQFLIDSEANVRASFSRMQSTEPAAPGGTKTPAGARTGQD